FLLVYVVHPVKNEKTDSGHQMIKDELKKLGKLSAPQFKVLMIFSGTAALWIFRSSINSALGSHLDDTIISIAAGVLLFVIPSGKTNEEGRVETLLEWKQTQKLPWGILLLFGGGMALAAAFKSSGLINYLGDYFSSLSNYPVLGLIVILAIAALFATELMSNLALVNVLIPVVAVIAVGMDLDPLIFAVPVTLAASCAFMLPMATPPNAIVFASGHVGIKQMAYSGLVMNLVASGLIALWVSICVHFSWL
ncbi:MAG: SLC13 family permease, partial [Flavobacteriales bacterium]